MFVALMVNMVRSSSCVGVPLIEPVAVSNDVLCYTISFIRKTDGDSRQKKGA